jgi:hypothetical protein
MSFRTFLQFKFLTARKSDAFEIHTIWHMKLFTTCLSKTKDVRRSILLRHNMQETSIYLSRKIISFNLVFCSCARHDDKFVTRLLFVTRIIWLTKLNDNSIAFISLSYSFSYIRRDSSRKIWAESETIDRDVWRLRLADAK